MFHLPYQARIKDNCCAKNSKRSHTLSNKCQKVRNNFGSDKDGVDWLTGAPTFALVTSFCWIINPQLNAVHAGRCVTRQTETSFILS